ncbi:MAG: DUF2470 domain-containing protein [Pseudomonadota bacterium]
MNSAREARQLLRAHYYGALSTLSLKFSGHPFGSITPYLLDHDGSALILISTLAEHTRNIQHDPRASLITHSHDNPHIQAQGRVTLVGTAALLADKEQAGARYLRYFPEARSYFAMHDFMFYRIAPLAVRYIAGFGKIQWVDMAEYALPGCPLIAQEEGVVAHMNADHRDTMRNYCRHLKQIDALDVEMLGIDSDGFDVRADVKILRFDFAEPVLDAQQARKVLVEMARAAR